MDTVMKAHDSQFKLKRSLLWIAALVAMPFLIPPAASADLGICPQGSGSGQCQNAEGVAADTSTSESGSGQIYVADTGNNRVNVFDSAGAFLFSFGAPGTGKGQFAGVRAVAVDNDPASPSRHSVYVFDGANFRVQKFEPDGDFVLMFGGNVNKTKVDASAPEAQRNLCPVDPGDVCQKGTASVAPGEFNSTSESKLTVGPGGVVHVSDRPSFEADPRVERFAPNGSFVSEANLAHQDRLNNGLAVVSDGDIYAAFNKGGGGIFRFEPDGSQSGPPYPLEPGFLSTALAVDGSDRVFAVQAEPKVNPPGSFRVITIYDSTGAILSRFGHGRIQNQQRGIAPLATPQGDVLVSSDAGNPALPGNPSVLYLELPPPGPIAAPPSVTAANVSNTKATLRAEVNPEGKASQYRFEYIDEASYEAEGDSFAGPSLRQTPLKAVPMPAGREFRLNAVEEQVGCPDPLTEAESGACLEPGTAYRFRVVATNADGAGEGMVERSFTTAPPFLFEAVYATEVGTDAARLHAELNPLGLPASGYFEYVSEADYQRSGFEEATQAPDVQGGASPLDFGSGEAPVERSASLYPLKPATAYRYRLVAENALSERASEEREAATFAPPVAAPCPNDAFRSGPAAFLPDCRAYELVSPLEKAGGDVIPLESNDNTLTQLNQSALSGEKLAYSSYRAFGDAASAPYISQYIATRTAGGWQSASLAPAQGRPVVEPNGLTNAGFKAFTDDLCRGWLRTLAEPALALGANPGFPNLYRRENCGPGQGSYLTLTNQPPQNGTPDRPFPGENYLSMEVQGASADGSHAVFAVKDSLAGAPGLGGKALQLYESDEGELRFVCVLPNGAPYPGPCSAGAAAETVGLGHLGDYENVISDDGERVYWTAAGLSSVGTGDGQIYLRVGGAQTVAVSASAESQTGKAGSRYRAAAADGSRALFTNDGSLFEFRLEGEENGEIAGEVLGLMGYSDNVTRVYFASREDLDDGATAGEPNLYLYQATPGGQAGEGEATFIATLSAEDLPAGTRPSPLANTPVRRSARATPSGSHLAFTSVASLTGYDNADAASGEPAAEVFIYEAASGELRCASCNPTGARPSAAIAGVVESEPFWAAALIPGADTVLYPSRALSSDGKRLYFEAADALSPRDTNGAIDVYQWEAEGSGTCRASSPSFAPRSGGCVELLSSGKSPKESVFLDADPQGEDAFFATLSSLAPADFGLIDIYDARAGGGFPPAPPPAPECEGEACRAPAPAPAHRTPASLGYRGPGNLAPAARKTRCPKGKRKARRAGKARCVRRKPSARSAKRAHAKRAHAKRAHAPKGDRR